MLSLVFLCHLASSDYISFEIFAPVSVIQPSTTSTPAYIRLGLFTSAGGFSNAGSVVISLSISPSNNIVGTACCTTTTGVCVLNNNLSFKYSGTYVLTASASGYSSGSSSSFTMIGVNPYQSMSISSSTTSITSYFSFTTSVWIYDATGSLTTKSCAVTLSESGGSAITVISSNTITGSGTITVYFTTVGSKTIVGTCSAISASTASISVAERALHVMAYTAVIDK